MSIPTELVKITKHKKPRYMIYQPGFNNSNSCWLEGEWIQISKEEWEQKQATHQKLYENIKEEIKGQYYNDEKTKLKDMTLAQKQAWKFYSGSQHLECFIKGCEERVITIEVNLSGRAISKKSVERMKKKNYLVIRYVTTYGKIKDQTKGIKIPKELLLENKEPVDTVLFTIRGNNKQSDYFIKVAFLDINDSFRIGVGIHGIIKLEEEIIRSEWHESIGKKDFYDDVKSSIERYKELRKLATDKLGIEKFQQYHQEFLERHNSCERNNLDNSDGKLYCYVLPKFNEDGTHEPWGEKDVPWGIK